MERFVVDNSIVMAWCFEDEESLYADIVLDSLAAAQAVVPAVWPLEVVNVLLVAERSSRLSARNSVRFISLISQLPIIIDRSWPERNMKELLALGRANGLSSYDAAYLELAMREGLPMATADKGLLRAANQVGVPIYKI